MRFPVPEEGYREALSHFNSLAFSYERANSSYGWSQVADRWVRDNYVEANIDTDFFDWQRIELPYREVVANYYAKKYPELPISAEPRELKYFFSASEFSTSAGSEFSRDGKDEKEIYAFNLGAWPAFRNCLIEQDPDEAAHLATVISEQTTNDWRPVGRRDIKDPLLFLKRLQAGVAVRENVRFTLYRLQS